MTTTAANVVPDTESSVLAFARARRVEADRAEAELLQAAAQWAGLHRVEHLDEAECYGRTDLYGNRRVPLAGPGAPLVEEFATHEFAAALGLGPEAGKRYVGLTVLEPGCYRWRSPHGLEWVRDHTGTRPLHPPGRD